MIGLLLLFLLGIILYKVIPSNFYKDCEIESKNFKRALKEVNVMKKSKSQKTINRKNIFQENYKNKESFIIRPRKVKQSLKSRNYKSRNQISKDQFVYLINHNYTKNNSLMFNFWS